RRRRARRSLEPRGAGNRRPRRGGLRHDPDPGARALGRQAGDALPAALASRHAVRRGRPGLADGDRPPPREAGRRGVHDAVRAVDAAEQARPARPVPVRPDSELGHPRGDRRRVPGRGRRVRHAWEHRLPPLSDPAGEPRPRVTRKRPSQSARAGPVPGLGGSNRPVGRVRYAAVRSGLTRRRLLGAAAAAGLFGAVPADALARDTKSPQALALTVRGSPLPFAGDRPMFVTIAPGVTGRDVATVRFALDRRAQVQLDAVLMGIGTGSVAWTRQATLSPGAHEIQWRPALDTPVGSYVMRLSLSKDGRRRVYGGKRPRTPDRATAPVVHLLG